MKAIVLALSHENDFQRIEFDRKADTHFAITARGERSVANVARAMGDEPAFPLTIHIGTIHVYCDFGDGRSGDTKLMAELFSLRHLNTKLELPTKYLHRIEDISKIVREISFWEALRYGGLGNPGRTPQDTLVLYCHPNSGMAMNFLEAFNLVTAPLLGLPDFDWRALLGDVRRGFSNGLVIDLIQKKYISIPALVGDEAQVTAGDRRTALLADPEE